VGKAEEKTKKSERKTKSGHQVKTMSRNKKEALAGNTECKTTKEDHAPKKRRVKYLI